RMIPNGVRFTPPQRVTLRDELQLGPDDRLVVAVGNLYPVKGHLNLIDAFGLIAGRYPNLHVAISGRGGLADSLMAPARAHDVPQGVHLLRVRAGGGGGP